MLLLTPEQLQEIRQIIEDHHDAFAVNTIGAETVSAETLEALREKGLINVKIESVKDAYIYGQMLAMVQSGNVAGMDYSEFKSYLKRNPIPLSVAETHAVQMAQASAGQYCRGLGNRVNLATGATIIEADATLRARTEGIIRDATALNIARRETVQKLKSDLGWATKDWARDWKRIAVTEKQNALQRGIADHYRDQYGPDVLVAKRAMASACPQCQRAYNGPDGQPRIFRLSDLEANGTNVGRKAADTLPVVGAHHPGCLCQMIRVPDGWGFDEDGQMVPGGKLGVVYESEEDMERSLRQEDGLQKAFRLQGHVNFKGLPIAIENRIGTVRKWKDSEGNEGETEMTAGYGYIKRTNGADEDEIDVYVGPDPMSNTVYIVHQQDPATGTYDETKCIVGVSSAVQARALYDAHYDRPDFFSWMEEMTLDAFKRWTHGTAPAKGEMMTKAAPGLRMVLPMQKARVPAEVGAVTGRAAGRSPSQYGTGPNYIMGYIPRRPVPPSLAESGTAPTMRDLLDDFYHDFDMENPLKVDREAYSIREPLKRVVRPIEIPKDVIEAQVAAREGHEQRMHYLLTEVSRNVARPLNTVEIKEKDDPQ